MLLPSHCYYYYYCFQAYARAAVAAIGYETVVSPYWSHALQIWALKSLPEWLVASLTLSMHHGIRKAGMKKLDKQKAEDAAAAAEGKGDKKHA